MIGGEVNSDRGLGKVFVTERAAGVSAMTANVYSQSLPTYRSPDHRTSPAE
jgi:hypothetical protein